MKAGFVVNIIGYLLLALDVFIYKNGVGALIGMGFFLANLVWLFKDLKTLKNNKTSGRKKQ